MLDVVESGLLDAVREGRTSAAGRLAASLLRPTGAWPWAVYGADPVPLLERLHQIEPLVAADPAAHVRVMCAIATGSIYGPDASLPERLSSAALALADELGDSDVIADALLARVIAFVGVAGHSVEAVDLMHRLIALPHRQSRLDEVIANAMMTMTQFNLGNIDVALDYVRRAITGSDLLRLPIIRVQMRWMTGELAHWLGDFAAAKREYAAAATFHLQTELYTAGSTDLAIHTLLWDQGALATLSGPEFAERKAWQATFAAVRGDVDEAETRVAEWLDEARHPVWTTLGHQVLVAHVLADIGRPARATQLLALLSPFSDRLANIGQVGHVGPVSLAIARLQVLIGDLAAARAALTQAIDLCERARGLASLLRCRLLEAELETGEAQREALLRNVISETARLGMAGVEAQARRLLLTS